MLCLQKLLDTTLYDGEPRPAHPISSDSLGRPDGVVLFQNLDGSFNRQGLDARAVAARDGGGAEE